MGTTPGRVFKGKKMAGHMGNKKLTVTGLEVIEVDEGKNLLLIKGAIPGPTNGFLIIELYKMYRFHLLYIIFWTLFWNYFDNFYIFNSICPKNLKNLYYRQ